MTVTAIVMARAAPGDDVGEHVVLAGDGERERIHREKDDGMTITGQHHAEP